MTEGTTFQVQQTQCKYATWITKHSKPTSLIKSGCCLQSKARTPVSFFLQLYVKSFFCPLPCSVLQRFKKEGRRSEETLVLFLPVFLLYLDAMEGNSPSSNFLISVFFESFALTISSYFLYLSSEVLSSWLLSVSSVRSAAAGRWLALQFSAAVFRRLLLIFLGMAAGRAWPRKKQTWAGSVPRPQIIA